MLPFSSLWGELVSCLRTSHKLEFAREDYWAPSYHDKIDHIKISPRTRLMAQYQNRVIICRRGNVDIEKEILVDFGSFGEPENTLGVPVAFELHFD